MVQWLWSQSLKSDPTSVTCQLCDLGQYLSTLCLSFSIYKTRIVIPTAGFAGGLDGKESACNAGDLGLVPGLGRSLGGGHGNPLQYSCLENLHGQRSLAGCSPWGRKEWDTTERLSTAHNAYCKAPGGPQVFTRLPAEECVWLILSISKYYDPGSFSTFPASAQEMSFLGNPLAFLLHRSLYKMSVSFWGPQDGVLKGSHHSYSHRRCFSPVGQT